MLNNTQNKTKRQTESHDQLWGRNWVLKLCTLKKNHHWYLIYPLCRWDRWRFPVRKEEKWLAKHDFEMNCGIVSLKRARPLASGRCISRGNRGDMEASWVVHLSCTRWNRSGSCKDSMITILHYGKSHLWRPALWLTLSFLRCVRDRRFLWAAGRSRP